MVESAKINFRFVLSFTAVLAEIIMVFVASFVSMSAWLRVVLIAFALVMIFAVAFIAVGIEQKAGYYECQSCGHRYVPAYWQTNLAPHAGRTRYMKCPKCGKRSWQRKALTKEESNSQETFYHGEFETVSALFTVKSVIYLLKLVVIFV